MLREDSALSSSIATHTGIPEGDVGEALDHLLRRKHPIVDYETGETVMRQFDPDADQAEALIRLSQGAGTPTDLLLLNHELAEARYAAAHPGCTYQEAHRAANELYNWQSAMEGE